MSFEQFFLYGLVTLLTYDCFKITIVNLVLYCIKYYVEKKIKKLEELNRPTLH